MDRRNFFRMAGAGIASGSLAEAIVAEHVSVLRHHTRHGTVADELQLHHQAELPNMLLGKNPERDRKIDDVCQMIRNTSRAGIPTLKYNLTFLGAGGASEVSKPYWVRLMV